MITNPAGEVAMRYFNNIPKYIMLGNKHEYLFTQHKYGSYAWIKPEDVGKILAVMHDCHCGSSAPKPAFRLATQQEVNLWTGQGDVHPS